jgi:hypothetical protein
MNKKTILVVLVLLLLAGGGAAAYFKLSHRLPEEISEMRESDDASASHTQATTPQKKSLKDLFSAGIAQQCTYTAPSNTSGKVYISSGKMRGDFTAQVDAKPVATHMIVDGQTSYVWMEDQTTGFKMTFSSPSPAVPTGSPSSPQGQMDVNQQVDVTCLPWVADTSFFTLPSGVDFKDFSSMMVPPSGAKKIVPNVTGTTDMRAQQCSACDQLSGDAAAQCKSALGCE